MWDELELYSYTRDGLAFGSPQKGIKDFYMQILQGCDSATWSFREGVGGVDQTGLRAWFYNRLMTMLIAKYDHKNVFTGFVTGMELNFNGLYLTTSIDNMANAVIASYTHGSTGEVTYTDWFVDQEAIDMFGWKEKVVSVNTTSQEEAEVRAIRHLMYYVDPYRSPGTFRKTTTPSLKIEVRGHMAFGNHVFLLPDRLRYHPDHTQENGYYVGAETTVGDEIQRILEVIQYNSGWLYPVEGGIAENPTVTYMGAPSLMGAWDRLEELAKVPVPDDPDLAIDEREWTHMELFVQQDGGVHYRPREEEVLYHRYPPPRGFEKPDGSAPTWDSRPGFIRIMDPQHEPRLPSSWIQDGNKVFAERVVMRMTADKAELHERDEDLDDLYSDIESYEELVRIWEETQKEQEELALL